MNRDNLTPVTIAAVIAAGFDVYMPNKGQSTYMFFTDGKNIGYLQNDRLYGLKLTTVHIPNRQTGTGFGVDTIIGDPITKADLSTAFMTAPNWASHNERLSVRKYADWDAFKAAYWDRSLERVIPSYRRGRSDYAAIRDLANDPAQVATIVSEEETEEMLCCVPPIYISGVPGFLVGEALTSDERGTVYANYFTSRDGLPCARYHSVKLEG